jgi:hypothetical protein
MAKQINLTKLLSSNWLITLTATLVGVFLALYLNERVNEGKVADQKAKAAKDIREEIANNREEIKSGLKAHKKFYDIFFFLSLYLDKEKGLVAPADSVQKIRVLYPEALLIKDSVEVKEGFYDYEGEINADFSVHHILLSDFAWSTLKGSSLSSEFDFDCLVYLERMNRIQDEIASENKKLIAYMTGEKDPGENYELILRQLGLLINFEESLLEFYEQSLAETEECF